MASTRLLVLSLGVMVRLSNFNVPMNAWASARSDLTLLNPNQTSRLKRVFCRGAVCYVFTFTYDTFESETERIL